MNEHTSYRVMPADISDRARPSFVAVCVCGWRSSRYSSGGLAGGAWDEHVAGRTHDTRIDEPHRNRFVPSCSCGWVGATVGPTDGTSPHTFALALEATRAHRESVQS